MADKDVYLEVNLMDTMDPAGVMVVYGSHDALDLNVLSSTLSWSSVMTSRIKLLILGQQL